MPGATSRTYAGLVAARRARGEMSSGRPPHDPRSTAAPDAAAIGAARPRYAELAARLTATHIIFRKAP